MAKKNGLGMGLDALFDDNFSDAQAKQTLRLGDIEPNKEQPRHDFDEASIANLADSIRTYGLLQPILVTRIESGGYKIVAGERRWRACRMLGMSEVPVIIKELSDVQTAQIALIENLQREDLNPLEEALGYDALIKKYGMTQDAVGKTVGKPRSSVANALRLLNMAAEIREMVRSGDISVGHAKALFAVEDEEMRLQLAKKAAKGELTVRAIEKIAAKAEKPAELTQSDTYYTEMELALADRLGRHVKIKKSANKGVLELEFYDKEDLAALGELLTHGG